MVIDTALEWVIIIGGIISTFLFLDATLSTKVRQYLYNRLNNIIPDPTEINRKINHTFTDGIFSDKYWRK